MRLADLLLAIAAVPALCAGSYLLWLTLLSRRSAPPAPGPVRHRFEIDIPAHNEESGIAQTIRSVLAIDYPQDMFAVTVIADNCTDQTAEVAQAAGARVLVREDQAQRGKGYALAYAFARILGEGRADALVVIDADTVVSPNLLRAFSARLETGAQAVQADYAVLNPSDSWRTRLMGIACTTRRRAMPMGRWSRARWRHNLSGAAGRKADGSWLSETDSTCSPAHGQNEAQCSWISLSTCSFPRSPSSSCSTWQALLSPLPWRWQQAVLDCR